LDYLLKPFDDERFHEALDRGRRDLHNKGASQKTLISLLERLGHGHAHLQQLVVKSGARVVFLKAAEIDWFEASGIYVTLHVGRETHFFGRL
jgi:two-component system LytT family response regulator